MMRGALGWTFSGGRRRLRSWTAVAACTVLAACGQTGSTDAPSPLAKPTLVTVGEFDSAPDAVLVDPAFAAQISRRMSGITEYSIRNETLRRAGATIRQQLVASLRAGGLPAEAGAADNVRIDVVTLVVTGRLRSLDEAALRQRKLSPAARNRILADIKVVHADGISTKTLLTFEAEDTAGGAAPARAGRSAPAGGGAPPAATPGAATEPLSPDIDAHMRRIANVAADRILATAAEQGWKPAAARTAR